MSSWITTKLLGIRQVLSGSTILPQRGTLNFIAGATVADNPATGATDVSITADNIFTNATHLALPDTIVERAPDGSANFGGTCDFEVINVGKDATFGGALSCAILTASESVTCGGIMTCAVMNTGDLGASGNIFAAGSLDCGALNCTQVYSAGNAVVGGTITVVGGASVSGNIVNSGNILSTGNITTTAGTITCPGAATVGSLTTSGAASVGSLTTSGGAAIGGAANITGLATVGSLTCSGAASVGSLNCGGSATLGSLTCGGAASLLGATTAANFTMTATNKVKLASRSLTRAPGSIFVPFSTGWSWVTPGAVPFPVPVTTVAGAASGWFALSLPDGCVITAVKVWVTPASGHAGLPASMPAVALYAKDAGSFSNGTQVMVQGDSAASVAAYQATHSITAVGSVTVDRASSYYVITVVSEGGANALAGFRIEGAQVFFTTSSMDDGYCG